MIDNTWEIMYLVDAYNDKIKRCRGREEITHAQKIYGRALQIAGASDEGLIMTVEDFDRDVRAGVITDYDGTAVFLDWDGNRKEFVKCDSEWIAANKKDYSFVRWFRV